MPTRNEHVTIDVPDAGEARVSGSYTRSPGASATLVVAHGAGAGMDHPFLVGFTDALNDAGVATLRFNFPYSRKFPDRAPVAVAESRRPIWPTSFNVFRTVPGV